MEESEREKLIDDARKETKDFKNKFYALKAAIEKQQKEALHRKRSEIARLEAQKLTEEEDLTKKFSTSAFGRVSQKSLKI